MKITSECANSIVAQLLYLESVDNEKPIFMYINSPGGQVYDALAIYDTLKVFDFNFQNIILYLFVVYFVTRSYSLRWFSSVSCIDASRCRFSWESICLKKLSHNDSSTTWWSISKRFAAFLSH